MTNHHVIENRIPAGEPPAIAEGLGAGGGSSVVRLLPRSAATPRSAAVRSCSPATRLDYAVIQLTEADRSRPQGASPHPQPPFR